MGGRRCLEHEGRMPVRQPYPAVAPIDRLAAIWRLDMPPARSLSTSRSLRMGNLCPGMPRSLQKGSRQCRFADHPTVPMTPIHSLVVIARNGWSRSIGTPGRNQSDQGSQSAGARSLPTLGRAVPPSPGVVYRCGRATSFPVPHCSSTTATSPNVPAIHTLSPATESGPGLQLVVVPDHQRAAPHIDVLMRRTRTGCRTSGLRDVLMTHLPARDRAALPRRPAGRGSA